MVLGQLNNCIEHLPISGLDSRTFIKKVFMMKKRDFYKYLVKTTRVEKKFVGVDFLVKNEYYCENLIKKAVNMYDETDKRYLTVLDEIGDKVYQFYNMSNRRDLIMVYMMAENKIYSYVYKDYLQSLNERSQSILKIQYKEAQETGKIVLFIRDDEMKKTKSYVI